MMNEMEYVEASPASKNMSYWTLKPVELASNNTEKLHNINVFGYAIVSKVSILLEYLL